MVLQPQPNSGIALALEWRLATCRIRLRRFYAPWFSMAKALAQECASCSPAKAVKGPSLARRTWITVFCRCSRTRLRTEHFGSEGIETSPHFILGKRQLPFD